MLGKLAVLLLLLTYGVLAQPATRHAAKSCRARTDLVGKCFKVRGRLSVYNGTPSIRLWRIGSRRILGVRDSDDGSGEPGAPNLPASIKDLLDGDREIVGDFLVCPLTRSEPGRMQSICIESGKHLVVRER